MRSGYRRSSPGRSAATGERAAYNLARAQARLAGRRRHAASLRLRRGRPARRLHRAAAEARGHPRAPADPPPRPARERPTRGAAAALLRSLRRPAHRRHRRPRGPRHRALRRLRHQDRRRRHARLPRPRVRRARTRSSCRSTSWRRSRRYVGAGGAHPPLSKLGGTRWETIKARARRAAQELAGELLNLYAERQRRRGHAFPPDSDWLREFEAAFPYHETPDQRDAIERGQGRHGVRAPDGPADLRRRRLRQDRGRAARRVQGRRRRQAGADARADDDPRPAALRHLRRAPARLPVHDRARLAASARRPSSARRSRRFTEGKVDILIGTHRLLSRDVRAEGPRADRSSTRSSASASSRRSCCASCKLQGRRDRDERDADPAHAADVARRPARHLA